MHAVRRDAFPRKILVRRRLGRKAVVGHGIGQDPIDLLGHRSVEAPEPRFDVGQRNAQLGRYQRPRQGRIHVADDQNEIGTCHREDLGQPLHDLGGLPDGRVRSNPEIHLGRRYPQVLEERTGHPMIEVLAGVDEAQVNLRIERELLNHRSDLDEVRSSPHDRGDVHAQTSAKPCSRRT